jgi:hypothetical protein
MANKKKGTLYKTPQHKEKGTLPSDMTRKLVANKEKRYNTVRYDQKTRIKKKGMLPSDMTRKLVANKEKKVRYRRI